MEDQTELSKKSTIEEIRTRFLLAIDDTRLNGSQIGRRIRELGSQKIYNLKNGRNGVTLENLISFSKECFPNTILNGLCTVRRKCL